MLKVKNYKHFRLIIVAEKQTVYKTFPIPLINRLEKHSLTMETMLSEQQLQLTKQLEHWVNMYKDARPQQVVARWVGCTSQDSSYKKVVQVLFSPMASAGKALSRLYLRN